MNQSPVNLIVKIDSFSFHLSLLFILTRTIFTDSAVLDF